MNFTKHINLINDFSDVEITIKDSNKTIKLNLHKIILSYECEYFYKMFFFDKTKNNYEMIAENADIMCYVIM